MRIIPLTTNTIVNDEYITVFSDIHIAVYPLQLLIFICAGVFIWDRAPGQTIVWWRGQMTIQKRVLLVRDKLTHCCPDLRPWRAHEINQPVHSLRCIRAHILCDERWYLLVWNHGLRNELIKLFIILLYFVLSLLKFFHGLIHILLHSFLHVLF